MAEHWTQQLANRVCDDYEVPHVTVARKFGHAGTFGTIDGFGTLELRPMTIRHYRKGRPAAGLVWLCLAERVSEREVLLHELAHWLLHKKFSGRISLHDDEWARRLVELRCRYMGRAGVINGPNLSLPLYRVCWSCGLITGQRVHRR